MKDETRLAHAGRDPFTHHGAVNVPVYHASTILSPDLDDFEKRDRRVTYGRTGTPTTFALEDIVSALEQADDTIICGSGLGAISTAMLAMCRAGDHVLATDNVYSPVRNVLDKVLTRYGIEIGYYDPTDLAALKDAITPKTRLIWLESPGSQTFELTDIRAVAEIAKQRDILTAIDNTWSGGYFLKPLTQGIDVSVQAATKYLGGHSDIMLGTISCNSKTADQVRSLFDYLGNPAGPDDIYLATRGARTLAVRMDRHYENGLKIAEYLENHACVRSVLHPALPSFPGHKIWQRDFTGASGLFGFIMECPDRDALAAMLDDMKLFGLGYSWGGFESLLIPTYPHTRRQHMTGKPDGQTMRIHVGLEDPDDLIADLDAGFGRLRRTG